MKKFSISFLFLLFVMTLFSPPDRTSAYTDYSQHRIITGEFYGEESVNNALQRLMSDTGWWAAYEPARDPIPYYQIYSGDYYNEMAAKERISHFQSSTGFSANYQPAGAPVPYQKIVTGYFYGEENVKRIIQDFTRSTGVNAAYEQTGEYVFKKRLVAEGFAGEDYTKGVIQQFQQSTGISSSYQPTGEYQEYKQFISGEFYDEELIKRVLQEFNTKTGLNANYEPVKYSDGTIISTGWFIGETQVQAIVNQIKKDLGFSARYESAEAGDSFRIIFNPLAGNSLSSATEYLDKKGWWYSLTPSDQKVPISFRIISEETIDIKKLETASVYFNSKNWWSTTISTGKKGPAIYRIVTVPLTENELNKGITYLNQLGIGHSTQITDEKDYSLFRIVTDPVLGIEQVGAFFSKNGWWYTTQATDKVGYAAYKIVTQPLLGNGKSDQALDYFKKNGLYATAVATGDKMNVYRIATGTFWGYENTVANAKMVTNRYGWWTTTEKVLNGPQVMTTNYNMTLAQMLNLQMQKSPQTDKYRNDPAYIYTAYIDPVNNIVTGNDVNIRSGPGTGYEIVAQKDAGFKDFRILGTEGEWTKIYLQFKDAKPADVEYYLNPNNFPSTSNQYFQFLKLSKPANIDVNEVNTKILNSTKGSLSGTAAAFAEAARLYNVNEIYLIAHALHETGNGQSSLAKGVQYNGRTVYNMYGYNAFDSCARDCGAKKAYDEGWFTPEAAIIGGAKLIGSGYIYNPTFQQDTLYKMRWNPIQTWHQYATDIGWAAKQITNMYNLYQLIDNYTLYFDLPVYE
ncbi:glucosaminidase domain-containing protein [Neobacillus niacini]|uniref:glucosaminidase domain-containing protein n=1 Tax=Neobacillus niacini TaxID=86668 RepID=UPI000AA07DE6|nr:glucosaminidase domain-containing protein [Neobacillus niacini]MEC1525882.1 glucosaminidase domain-containing protein [Neobacillus niacini]